MGNIFRLIHRSNLSRKTQRLLSHIITVFAGTCIVAIGFVFLQPFSGISHAFTNTLFVPTTVSQNIVIVGIDDASLDKYGNYSDWSRLLYVNAIQNLSHANAKVIGFDILFTDTSPNDPALAQAIEQAGNVVLPVLGDQALSSDESQTTYGNIFLPNAQLSSVAAAFGHANVSEDSGAVVGRLPLFVGDASGNSFPSLSLAILCNLFAQAPPVPSDIQDSKLQILGREIPVDSHGNMIINYSGKPGAYQQISFQAVVDGDFDPALVANKVVLIGMTASAEPDFWITPISSQKMSGVEIHANAIDTILRQRFLVDESLTSNVLICLLLGFVLAVALARLGLRWGGIVTIMLIGGYMGWVFYAFDHGHLYNMLYPVAVLLIAYITSLIFHTVDERREKQRVEMIFGRYVSPEVAREIVKLDDRQSLGLGGQRREVTVLFCDVRGFTTMSEQEQPETIINLINKHFALIIPCILTHKGIINKFAGDNIMALWGAPTNEPGHARLSVEAAVDAQKALKKLHNDNPAMHKMQFGFGIHTGEVVAGNVGSTGRMEYTVLGDVVNVAARLCGACPGDKIWVSSEVYQQVQPYVKFRPLEPQFFKGKEKPMVVYEVVE